jgi:hypothetical protein
MGFAFQAAVACCDIGTLFNPVILSGTLSFGKANDKVESKDPMFVDTTRGNARRSHRAVIARGPAKAAHATKLITSKNDPSRLNGFT